LQYFDTLKEGSDLWQLTTERGHEEISENIHQALLALEDFKLKQGHSLTNRFYLQFFFEGSV